MIAIFLVRLLMVVGLGTLTYIAYRRTSLVSTKVSDQLNEVSSSFNEKSNIMQIPSQTYQELPISPLLENANLYDVVPESIETTEVFSSDQVQGNSSTPIEIFDLKVNGLTFSLTLPSAEKADIISVATEFCKSHKVEFNLVDDMMYANCVEPVVEHLVNLLSGEALVKNEESIKSSIVEISVPVESSNGEKQVFIISFDVNINTPEEAALKLCIEQNSLFEVEESNIYTNCVKPISEFLKIKLNTLHQ